MDELELLKQDWQRKSNDLPKLSFEEIHKMIWKRSSSIVKWLFYISILEFVLWTTLAYALNLNDEYNRMQNIESFTIVKIFTVLGYVCLAIFIFLFFRNYKRISVIENVKTLMKRIITTRKTVKYYIAFNLVYCFVFALLLLALQVDNDPEIIALHQRYVDSNNEKMFYLIYYGFMIATILIFCLILWGFYYLVYGLLLRKLNRNYRELKQMEL
jgi:hypothetical protein